MFPFWDVAIAPVLEAARARADRRDRRAPGRDDRADARPSSGPTPSCTSSTRCRTSTRPSTSSAFPGRYVFHRDLSLDVLADARRRWTPRSSTATTTGTRSTTSSSCSRDVRPRRRARRCRCCSCTTSAGPTAGATSTTTPSRSRRSSASRTRQRGHAAGTARSCCRSGGLNPTMCNAEVEGGPRNGVMTALDDFIAEHDRPLRARRAARSTSGSRSSSRRSGSRASPSWRRVARPPRERRGPATSCSSSPRTSASQAMIFQHNVFYQRDRASSSGCTARYLDVVKARAARRALPRERGAARVPRSTALEPGRSPNADQLRDPVRHDAGRLPSARAQRARRRPARRRRRRRRSSRTPTMGRARLDHLERVPRRGARADGVAGDLVECGTGRGGGAIFMRALPRRARDRRPRRSGSPTASAPSPDADAAPTLRRAGSPASAPTSTSCATASPASTSSTTGPLPPGRRRRRRSPTRRSTQVALLRIGAGLGADVARRARRALRPARRSAASWSSTATRGRPCAGAVDAFRGRRGIAAPLERVDAATVVWRKDAPATAAAATPDRERSRRSRAAAAAPPAAHRRRRRPLRRRRLLQHAPRGGAHAPLAVARVPGGHRRPRLRGHRRRERLAPRTSELGDDFVRELRSRVPLPRPRRRGRRRRRSARSTAASRAGARANASRS